MSDVKFAAWKRRQEEKILRMQEESEALHRKTKETLAELAVASKKTEKTVDQVAKQLGGWTNNANKQLEDEFAEAVEEAMQIGDVRLDEVRQRVKFKYEYDLVGINGNAVVVGEIKRKLLPEDVQHFAENRLPHFAAEFPPVADGRKIFGMVAGETIVPAAKTEAEKRGFFILRLKNKKLQVDNTGNARPIN